MKRMKIFAAVLCMLFCIGIMSYEILAEPVVEGILANITLIPTLIVLFTFGGSVMASM